MSLIHWGYFCCCLSLVATEAVAQQPAVIQLKREINRIIRHEDPIDFERSPGALIGVLIEDSTYVFAVGQAPGKDAIFELGSLTKPVMAYLVSRIQSKLNLSDDALICGFIPDSVCHGPWKEITIGQLLHHTCGLPKVTRGMAGAEEEINDPYANYGMDELRGDILQINPVPGKYSYSHLNYMALQWLMEAAGGLENIRREYIEEELGFLSMRFEVPDSLITPGYGLNGHQRLPWHTKAMATAVGLKSNITDMLEFVQMASQDKDAPLMTKAFKRELETKARKELFEIANGWFLVPQGKNLMGFHTGHTGGHHTSAAFVFGKEIGVVVFSNGASGSGDLSVRVLEMLLKGHRSEE